MSAKHLRQMMLAGLIWVAMPGLALAQDPGTFMPHDGAILTTVLANAYGPDA